MYPVCIMYTSYVPVSASRGRPTGERPADRRHPAARIGRREILELWRDPVSCVLRGVCAPAALGAQALVPVLQAPLHAADRVWDMRMEGPQAA